MTVDAIDAGVQLSIDEPVRVRRLPADHLAPGLDPFQLARERLPERLGVAGGPLVDRGVVGNRLRLPPGGRGKTAVFLEQGVDFGHRRVFYSAVRNRQEEARKVRAAEDESAARESLDARPRLGRLERVLRARVVEKRAVMLDRSRGFAGQLVHPG